MSSIDWPTTGGNTYTTNVPAIYPQTYPQTSTSTWTGASTWQPNPRTIVRDEERHRTIDVADKVFEFEQAILKLQQDMSRLLDVVRELATTKCRSRAKDECGKCLPCKARIALQNESEVALAALARE